MLDGNPKKQPRNNDIPKQTGLIGSVTHFTIRQVYISSQGRVWQWAVSSPHYVSHRHCPSVRPPASHLGKPQESAGGVGDPSSCWAELWERSCSLAGGVGAQQCAWGEHGAGTATQWQLQHAAGLLHLPPCGRTPANARFLQVFHIYFLHLCASQRERRMLGSSSPFGRVFPMKRGGTSSSTKAIYHPVGYRSRNAACKP